MMLLMDGKHHMLLCPVHYAYENRSLLASPRYSARGEPEVAHDMPCSTRATQHFNIFLPGAACAPKLCGSEL